MENNNELDKFLVDKMSLNNLEIQEPHILLVAKARKKIQARKKFTREKEDFFSLIAAFLNFKIKLYHAVIVTIIIGSLILFFTKQNKEPKNEIRRSEYVSNIASVKSSTVLTSIYTFGLNKKTNLWKLNKLITSNYHCQLLKVHLNISHFLTSNSQFLC